MATPYDFMTREAGGNTYATGATRQANPYATPQTGPNAQQGMIRQPTQANQTTNPQTGSSTNQTFSLYGGSNQPQQQQASATTFNPNGPGRPGTSRYGPVTEANSFAAWNAQRPWGQQYGVAGTPGAYAVPQQQAQPQPNGGNVGGTYQQPQAGGYNAQMQAQMQQLAAAQQAQTATNRGNGMSYSGSQNNQSNPYGVDTSMGGGADPIRYGGIRGPAQPAQPQTGGYKGPAAPMQAQTGVGTRSLATYNQAGTSAQPTNRPTPTGGSAAQTQPGQAGWQSGPGATMPTTASQQTQPGQQAYGATWQSGPGATMPQMPQGGSGQTSPNPDPYGSPWVDYINADGSPHINYQYGQNSGGGGSRGPTGPNPGSDTYWQNPNAILNNNRDPRIPVGGYPAQNGHGPMPMPAMSTGQQGAQPQGSNGLPFTWEQYNAARNDNPRIAQEWAQMALPYQQLGQGAYQFDREFTEAQRRYDQQFGQSQSQQNWDQSMGVRQQTQAELAFQASLDQWNRQFGHQQYNDRFNQDMAGQQFTREGLQWDRQFGHQQLNDNRQFALQQTDMNNQYGLDRDRFGLAQTQANWGQQNAQQSLYYQGQDQSLRELDSTRNYGLAQNAQAMQAQDMGQTYGISLRNMSMLEENQRNQYGLSQNAQAMQREQMAHQMGIDTAGMTLAQITQATNAAFQQQQLGQQATLTREQLASQERQAVMAATGRQQAPNTKWVRSW
jgi:hypothetical protein